MVGRVDSNGEYTGDEIAWIYPDFKTAFFGEFSKGIMIKAKPARLATIVFNDGVLCPSFDVFSDR